MLLSKIQKVISLLNFIWAAGFSRLGHYLMLVLNLRPAFCALSNNAYKFTLGLSYSLIAAIQITCLC